MVEVTASSEIADAGTSFSLTCTVTSDFPASITWLSGQQPVLPSTADNISITHETLSEIQTDEGKVVVTKSIIKFYPIQLSHGDDYTCQSTVNISFTTNTLSQTQQVKVQSMCINSVC